MATGTELLKRLGELCDESQSIDEKIKMLYEQKQQVGRDIASVTAQIAKSAVKPVKPEGGLVDCCPRLVRKVEGRKYN